MKKIVFMVSLLGIIFVLSACSFGKSKETAGDETLPKYSFVNQSVKPFEVVDIDGIKHNQEVFTKQKLTMNVFWSPNCIPCIEELEALDKLHAREKELDLKVVSICVEGTKKDIMELRKSYKMDYPIIMMDEDQLMEECVKDFEFIPFVIFVDQNGKYLDDYLVGSRTYEEYLAHIQNILEKM